MSYGQSHKGGQGGSLNGFLNSFLMSALAFISVVLLHQLMISVFSLAFGYDTQVTFVQVISKPFENRYWSNSRVILFYAVPSLLYLVVAVALASNLLWVPQKITNWYRFRFWWMVFSVLYISTQVTMIPISVMISNGPFYTGIAVVASWWGFDMHTMLAFSCLSVAVNIVAGFVCARILMRFSPSRSLLQKQSGKGKIIRRYFFYPILLLLPVALFLSYPDGVIFFAVIFLHSLLWLPGFYLLRGNSIIIKGDPSISHLDIYEYEHIAKRSLGFTSVVTLPVFLLVLIILIRIFL